MSDDLARAATEAARAALAGWSPNSPTALEDLAAAIGAAVAVGVARHDQDAARHTALAMAGLDESEASLLNWQV